MRDERIKGCGTLSTETPAARERRVACVDTSIHQGLAHRELESDAITYTPATGTPARETLPARAFAFYAAEPLSVARMALEIERLEQESNGETRQQETRRQQRRHG
jgi:hypothetical protein